MAVSFVVAGGVAAAFLLNASGSGKLLELIKGHDEWETQGPRFIRQDAPDASGNHLMTFKLETAAPTVAPAVASQLSAAPVRSATQAVPARPAPSASSWIRHIRGTLALFSTKGPATQRSSASAGVSDVVAAQPESFSQTPAAVAASVMPAPPRSRAAYVHYGAASRSDIMSAGSGPVYNFASSKR